MSKEGIPAVYDAKGNDHIRHDNKTAQDRLPVAERPRVKAHRLRLDNMMAQVANTPALPEGTVHDEVHIDTEESK